MVKIYLRILRWRNKTARVYKFTWGKELKAIFASSGKFQSVCNETRGGFTSIYNFVSVRNHKGVITILHVFAVDNKGTFTKIVGIFSM